MEEADLKPHRSRYWLNAKAKDTDPEGFAAAASEVCDTYRRAPEEHMLGKHIESVDEKTGIQALERIAPTKPMRPGRIEEREFEYERHGTLCLTANFEVATGEIVGYTIAPTRTGRVRRPRQPKDRRGSTRGLDLRRRPPEHARLGHARGARCFLVRHRHRPRDQGEDRHPEIWFSVLVRRLLKRGDFKSLDDLRERIEAFIAYFNDTLAKPYRWTYTGRVLKAG